MKKVVFFPGSFYQKVLCLLIIVCALSLTKYSIAEPIVLVICLLTLLFFILYSMIGTKRIIVYTRKRLGQYIVIQKTLFSKKTYYCECLSEINFNSEQVLTLKFKTIVDCLKGDELVLKLENARYINNIYKRLQAIRDNRTKYVDHYFYFGL